ncbi:cation-transporting ATPase, putative (macronuclear) [Tetrahymena thermophila SB210]|uniref:Cation-transporting ATPase, putative n=1 Tax=Tetrahymena thermophila (strain SB210) TaxID=312017 RepID=Q23WM8_TETTS|nr:cation-transporting ATPase, putative [Tetrahymena thermophila SB210]EAS00952.1 cation-transporting ATPase, putative [Tetrahymena thermophila SB210]|eukprot:XP_001021197.1 cation-transporting ATPase, putative [Tetrahymena thermophila SB210]
MRVSSIEAEMENPIDVDKTDVEGELKIKQVTLLRENIVKKIVFFLVAIFCSDRPSVLKKVFYEEVSKQEEATHVYVLASDLTDYIEEASLKENPEEGGEKSIYFVNRLQKYIYHKKQNKFRAIEYFIQGKSYSEIANNKPLATGRVDQLLAYYGKSEIEINVPSFLTLMWREFKKPINFLLYFGIIVWGIEQMYVSTAITVVFTTTINSLICIYIRGVMQKLKDACLNNTSVIVQRHNGQGYQEITVASNMIAPGDIVLFKREVTLPFDCVILEGSCQVTEANITGENVAIGKCQIPTDHHNDIFKYESSKSHTLFQGTQLMKIEDDILKVIVVRTGFGSYKGQIIRALLYPKPFNKKFQQQAVKLTILMATLLLIGFLSTLSRLLDIELPPLFIAFRFLDILIYSAPPGMPMLIAITNFVGLKRLKNNQILGQDPNSASQAGRIQTLCFDKTGTLTEDKVDLIGYQLKGQNQTFDKIQCQDPNNISIEHKLFSICHEVTKINNKLLGDLMDVKMAEFSTLDIDYDHEAKQHYSKSGNKRFYCIQVNQFHSEYQSMSVVCKEVDMITKEFKHYFFIKGSPEKIQSLSHVQSSEKAQLSTLINEGYRILGFGYKEIPQSEIDAFLDLSREQQEANVQSLGFLIYKNNLKPDTQEVIKEFKEACYNIKVISGDNPITTLKISQELEIVNRKNPTVIINFEETENVKSHLIITEIQPDNSTQVIDFSSAQNEQDYINKQMSYCCDAFLNNKSFCFSGKAHYYFQLKAKTDHISFKPEWVKMQDKSVQKIISFYQMLIINTNVFARTQPEQKQTIVRLLKESDQIVCMVGDGANDCSAIREADVGISFAEADGQFSSSYVSLSTSLSCVKRVLLEGRVNLSNSVEIFKGYLQVALLRYLGFLTLAYFYSSYSSGQMDWQALASGYFLVYLILGCNTPLKKLEKSVFDDNLFSIYNVTSVLFGFTLHILSIVGCVESLHASPIYKEVNSLDAENNFQFETQHNTVLNFNILINFFYVIISNHIGKPMKDRYYKNTIAYLMIWGQFIHANVMIFTSSAYPGAYTSWVDLPDTTLRLRIFFISNGLGLLLLAYELIFARRIFVKLYTRSQERKRAAHMQQLIDHIRS